MPGEKRYLGHYGAGFQHQLYVSGNKLMKPTAIVMLALLSAAPAWAQQSLDLSLPKDATAPQAGQDAPATRADPPGLYYGDTSGQPGVSPGQRSHDSRPIDDGSAQVWGSVSTMVGYAKHQGSFFGSAANINVGKSFGENNQGRVVFSMDVNQMDGPGLRTRGGCDSTISDEPCPPAWRP